MTDLCIVPCHAPLIGGNPASEQDWILEDFQRDGGHHVRCFLAHIKAGFAWLESNPGGLLILSGGLTRPGCRISEAASYLLAAQKCGSVSDQSVITRVILEDCARDSFENTLLGVAAGFAHSQVRPERVVVIGFEFKRDRFLDHFGSLQLGPGTTCDILGLNNPIEPNLTAARTSEARTRAAFASTNPADQQMLRAKRERRSWPGRRVPYAPLCRAWPALYRKLSEWDAANP